MSRAQSDLAGAGAGGAYGAAVGAAFGGPVGAIFGGLIGAAAGYSLGDAAYNVAHPTHPAHHHPETPPPKTPTDPPIEPDPPHGGDEDGDDPYDPGCNAHHWHMCIDRRNEVTPKYGKHQSKYVLSQKRAARHELASWFHHVQRHPVIFTAGFVQYGIPLLYSMAKRAFGEDGAAVKLRQFFRSQGYFQEAMYDGPRGLQILHAFFDRLYAMSPRARHRALESHRRSPPGTPRLGQGLANEYRNPFDSPMIPKVQRAVRRMMRKRPGFMEPGYRWKRSRTS